MTPDRMIAALAAGQGGVASRDQLLDLGLGIAAIDHRLRPGAGISCSGVSTPSVTGRCDRRAHGGRRC
jgi:hypothetical protein